jgi:hypothetical protein
MTNQAVTLSQRRPLLSVKHWLVPLLARPRVAHGIKYIVYLSLLVNFALYIRDDYFAFRSALPAGAPLLDILIQFSTSIDMAAWLGLVVLFELETYTLAEEAWTKLLTGLLRSVRLVCYLMIAYAAYGYTAEALDNFNYTEVAGASDICDLADGHTSLLVGVIEYVEITPENCENLSDDSTFYQFEGEVSVIEESALPHVQFMGLVDICNAFVWLIVVILIEIEVWLQTIDRFSSPLLTATRQVKTLFYLVLMGNGIIWLFGSYYLYTWDAFLWIFGFWAIELNLAEWEIERVHELRTQ